MSESQRTHIGRYELRERIGGGGMANVHKAYDPETKRDVAIKLLHPMYAKDRKFVKLFQREAKMPDKLKHPAHPAIVPIYDSGEDDGQLYIVMRYMKGGTLQARLKRSTMSLDEIIQIIERVGSALDEAHRNNIVHLDVKPANILFDENANPFLADFGIAHIANETQIFSHGKFFGTPAYMSPEQVSNRGKIDGRSDLYSLGIILYEMLAYKKPYDADEVIQWAWMHVNEDIPRIGDELYGLKKWNRVIKRALAKKPSNRYQTGAALTAAVKKTVETETKWPHIYFMIGGFVLLLLASVLGWLIWDGTNPTVEVSSTFTPSPTVTETTIPSTFTPTPLPTVTSISPIASTQPPCTRQDQYELNVDVERPSFQPKLGEVVVDGDPFTDDITVSWTVENRGCKVSSAKLVDSAGKVYEIVFVSFAGNERNTLEEGDDGEVHLRLDSPDEANAILGKKFQFIVEAPNGEEFVLDEQFPIQAEVNETWFRTATPTPTATSTSTNTPRPTNTPPRPTPTNTRPRPTNTPPRPTPTNTRPRPTNTPPRPTPTNTRPRPTNTPPRPPNTPVGPTNTSTECRVPSSNGPWPTCTPTSTLTPTPTVDPAVRDIVDEIIDGVENKTRVPGE